MGVKQLFKTKATKIEVKVGCWSVTSVLQSDGKKKKNCFGEETVCRSVVQNQLLHRAEMVKVEDFCIYSINIENYLLDFIIDLFTFLSFHYIN